MFASLELNVTPLKVQLLNGAKITGHRMDHDLCLEIQCALVDKIVEVSRYLRFPSATRSTAKFQDSHELDSFSEYMWHFLNIKHKDNNDHDNT